MKKKIFNKILLSFLFLTCVFFIGPRAYAADESLLEKEVVEEKTAVEEEIDGKDPAQKDEEERPDDEIEEKNKDESKNEEDDKKADGKELEQEKIQELKEAIRKNQIQANAAKYLIERYPKMVKNFTDDLIDLIKTSNKLVMASINYIYSLTGECMKFFPVVVEYPDETEEKVLEENQEAIEKIDQDQKNPMDKENMVEVNTVADGVIRGNKNTMVYHLPGGRYYDKISPQNIVNFDSEEDAIKAGYTRSQY